MRDTAAELLNLYARRAARQGHAFQYSARDYEAFAESFGFEETADQSAAITAVINDMTDGKPVAAIGDIHGEATLLHALLDALEQYGREIGGLRAVLYGRPEAPGESSWRPS